MIELPADAGAGLGLFQELHGAADRRCLRPAPAGCIRAASRARRAPVPRAPGRRSGGRRGDGARDHGEVVVAAPRARRNRPGVTGGQPVRPDRRRRRAGQPSGASCPGRPAPPPRRWPRASRPGSSTAAAPARPRSARASPRCGRSSRRMDRAGSRRPGRSTQSDPTTRVINRAGFRRRDVLTEDERTGAKTYGPWEYFVLPEAWRREVCKGFDHKAIARALAAQGGLVLGDGRNLPATCGCPGWVCGAPDARSPVCLRRKPVGTVGAVGTARQTASFRRSDREHRSRNSRNTGRNWSGPVPTAPTMPRAVGTTKSPMKSTMFRLLRLFRPTSDTRHTGENDSDPNGAADDRALTCAHCGAAFLRKPRPGRPAEVLLAGVPARGPGGPDEGLRPGRLAATWCSTHDHSRRCHDRYRCRCRAGVGAGGAARTPRSGRQAAGGCRSGRRQVPLGGPGAAGGRAGRAAPG